MPNRSIKACEEKGRLLQRYTDLTHAFSEAVDALNARRGVTVRDEYGRLERAVLDARLKSEQARLV